MAFQDSAGNNFTNHSDMKRSQARIGAKQPAAPPEAQAPDQSQDILQSPEVQQVFQVLAQAGVSPEELSQAYAQVSGDADQSQEQGAPQQ